MIVLSSTVLPQPLSPMIASVWPRGIASVMSRSTGWRPKLTLSSLQLDQRVSARRFRLSLRFGLEHVESTSAITSGQSMSWTSVEPDAEEQIEHQDDDERQHERRGRRPADAFGARCTVEAAVATHDGDRRAEEDALEDAVEQVPVVRRTAASCASSGTNRCRRRGRCRSSRRRRP